MKVVKELLGSKKFWVTLSSAAASIAVLVYGPEKAELIAGVITSLGGVLVWAIGKADEGKEAARLKDGQSIEN